MSKEKYYPPKQAEEKFHCPHCNVFAKQFWAHIEARYIWSISTIKGCKEFKEVFDEDWTISRCEHCSGKIIWFRESIIYPKKILVSLPNEDLDEDIKIDYLEAANIYSDSPRASAALLRLALQKLCVQLGEKGDSINDDIKKLVKKGLNPLVQKSLDSLRIAGNNAVHLGEIRLDEEPKKVLKLFELINFIAQKMISEPGEIESFYGDLPENLREAVEKRDE